MHHLIGVSLQKGLQDTDIYIYINQRSKESDCGLQVAKLISARPVQFTLPIDDLPGFCGHFEGAEDLHDAEAKLGRELDQVSYQGQHFWLLQRFYCLSRNTVLIAHDPPRNEFPPWWGRRVEARLEDRAC